MIGIKYISLHDRGGYGTAAKRYILGLKNCGVSITWSPMVLGWRKYVPFPGTEIEDEDLRPLCNLPIAYDTVVIHTIPEYYPLWVQREKGKKIIGYTVWETDKLPGHWLPLLNLVDRLIVPSRWNQEVFQRCGVERPVGVVPHIAQSRPPAENCLLRKLRFDDFVFYCISDWTARKSIWNTVRCYLDTFTNSDPTVLVLKTSRLDFTKHYFHRCYGTSRQSLRKIMRNYPHPAKIFFLDQDLTEDEILQIHQKGDCYISLCRSEGWGLGAFDAAAGGRPVIMTGYGGQLDYLLPQHSYIVQHRMIAVQDDDPERKEYSPDQNWAQPDLVHASRLMKHVFANRTEALQKGQKLREFILSRFEQNTISRKFIAAIDGGVV